jgi:hypothetical protein
MTTADLAGACETSPMSFVTSSHPAKIAADSTNANSAGAKPRFAVFNELFFPIFFTFFIFPKPLFVFARICAMREFVFTQT